MESPSQELAKAISIDRARMDVAQDVIAEHIGVSQQAVSGWEDGKSFPRKKRLEKLVEYFGEASETAKVAAKYAPTLFDRYRDPGSMRADASGEFVDKLWNDLVEAKKTGAEVDHLRPKALSKETWDNLIVGFDVDHKLPKKDHWVVLFKSSLYEHSKPTARKATVLERQAESFQYWDTQSKIPDTKETQSLTDGLNQAKYGIMLARQALDNAAEEIEKALNAVKHS